MSGFIENIKERFGIALSEPGTWKAIVMLASAFGATFTKDEETAIITAGIAVSGLIGLFFKDDKNSKSISDSIADRKKSIESIDSTDLSDIVSGTRDEK
jgi:hypothetical protein